MDKKIKILLASAVVVVVSCASIMLMTNKYLNKLFDYSDLEYISKE